MKKILSILFSLVLFGCSNNPSIENSRISIGKITDSNLSGASYGTVFTIIKTETRVITLDYRIVNVDIGKQAYITSYSDGSHGITWDGMGNRYWQIR